MPAGTKIKFQFLKPESTKIFVTRIVNRGIRVWRFNLAIVIYLGFGIWDLVLGLSGSTL